MTWQKAMHDHERTFYWLDAGERSPQEVSNGMSDAEVWHISGPYATEAAIPGEPPKSAAYNGKAHKKNEAWANQQLLKRLWVLL